MVARSPSALGAVREALERGFEVRGGLFGIAAASTASASGQVPISRWMLAIWTA
jgi:hypothetical protein